MITVNAGPDIDAANNDYRRIQNALNAAASGDTIVLNGTFDFTQPFAAAAWALGNDNTASTGDDYEVLAPGVSNVTLTATSLGSATIQGPGDLAAVNLEAFLVFDASLSGASQGWTISNLRILDFDMSMGMFEVAAGDFNNTHIQNNFIRIPNDLNATVAPIDVNQNIGIVYGFGTNQVISGNSFQVPGDGVSAGANTSTSVVMQSSTSGGSAYDGLTISNNVIHVLNAQSANPQVTIGIWENGHANTSNITVSNNSFINDAVGNSPALNQERAFRVTSHSSPTTTVKYDSNTVSGANIGFQWITGADFTGNQAVVLTGNTITNSDTGVLVQSNGIAHITHDAITGSGSGGGLHVVTGMLTASGAEPDAGVNSVVSGSSSDGILIDATVLGNSDLSITKTPAVGLYGTGSQLTYTISVANAGPVAATSVVVTDVLPAGTSFVSATPSQGSCSGTTTVTCSLGTLANGASATIALTVTLPAVPGLVSNTATVASGNPDPNMANNSSTASITVISAAAIPTASPWALLMLGLVLVAIGLLTQRLE